MRRPYGFDEIFVGARHASPSFHMHAVAAGRRMRRPYEFDEIFVEAMHASPSFHMRPCRRRATHASPLRI